MNQTINEIKENKLKLESEIKGLILKFNAENEIKVGGVDVSNDVITSMGGQKEVVFMGVGVTLVNMF